MRLEHRVTTSATPAQVWSLIGDPSSWPLLDLTLRGVRGGGGRVAVGQRLMGLVRLSAIGIPIDVVEVVPGVRLSLLVHTAPGLREQLSFDLTPSVRRGTDIRMSLVVEGPLGPAALLPRWVANCLAARVLAARTDRQARIDRRTAA
ncbi:MAG: Polyketide cyclase / dehydrase and lipid transport [Actinomycetota bacterium]|nr:Polyketide cyclase / dehydrase and lipid transport [Actinomycetota bacterium]